DGGKVGAGDGARSVFGKIDAVYRNAAAGGSQYAEDHVDGGGFPGAVGAEQADDLVLADGEGDMIHRRLFAVALRKIIYREDGVHGGHSLRGWQLLCLDNKGYLC